MELIHENEMIECDACGKGVTIAIKFLNRLYENQDVVICNQCIMDGSDLINRRNHESA